MDIKAGLQFPSIPPTMSEKWKTWMWPIIVLFLLVVIVIGATLVGVYMTQKYTEQVVEMALQSQTGENVQQTVMVNDGEKVAAFYVKTNNVSSTILYDYSHAFIGFRHNSRKNCYVVKMDKANVPTMSDILKTIKQYQEQSSISDGYLSYNLVPGEEADRTKLGIPINILCSDVPIFWATLNDSPHQRWFSISLKVFGFRVLDLWIGR